ncbi:RRXRR domain-containing protein [Streptomyces sp. H34-S4]|uniref:RRXRR domain-containing protein n=1 Tax=Streptomyces sp. H34-S4 TaxID=2996463 RepID=UPI00226DE3B0|nr:RRXRR domain-containing protein [Streptomyces sp. H34-S4]MCY0936149.1 RRXRR domain-containing protein [Streptomyces sp. H34-S4]
MPCHPARARELLDGGRAVVARRAPFVIIRLTRRPLADSEVDGVEVRIDPGSKRTGIAVSEDRVHKRRNGAAASVRRGLVAVELRHRGAQIRDGLRRRAGYRRRRRSGNLRYRAPRNRNRTRPDGWLPPSLLHRVESTLSLVRRLCRYAPVTAIHVELSRPGSGSSWLRRRRTSMTPPRLRHRRSGPGGPLTRQVAWPVGREDRRTGLRPAPADHCDLPVRRQSQESSAVAAR